MIKVENMCKHYMTRQGHKNILQNISFTVKKGEKLGILGCNGAGKSTLIRIIGGIEQPSSGSVTRSMRVSWPLALEGAMVGGLSGMDNLRFVCRIYNVDFESSLGYVKKMSELGNYLYEPVKTYSSGMRARLAFAMSLVVDFDCYLIDEVSAVGDKRFNAKLKYELMDRTADRSVIMVSHFYGVIQEYCDRAAVLNSGELFSFQNIESAIAFYDKTLNQKTITF